MGWGLILHDVFLEVDKGLGNFDTMYGRLTTKLFDMLALLLQKSGLFFGSVHACKWIYSTTKIFPSFSRATATFTKQPPWGHRPPTATTALAFTTNIIHMLLSKKKERAAVRLHAIYSFSEAARPPRPRLQLKMAKIYIHMLTCWSLQIKRKSGCRLT